MDSDKLIRILKIVLVISMIIFVIMVTKFKTNDCQHCSFDVDGRDMGVSSFVDYYFEECIDLVSEYKQTTIINISDNIIEGGISYE